MVFYCKQCAHSMWRWISKIWTEHHWLISPGSFCSVVNFGTSSLRSLCRALKVKTSVFTLSSSQPAIISLTGVKSVLSLALDGLIRPIFQLRGKLCQILTSSLSWSNEDYPVTCFLFSHTHFPPYMFESSLINDRERKNKDRIQMVALRTLGKRSNPCSHTSVFL